MVVRRLLVVVAVAAWFAVPGTADAAVNISGLNAKPCGALAPAGGHVDFCMSFNLSTTDNDDARVLQIDLPPGVIGDPMAAAQCASATFQAGGCTMASRVGTASATVAVVGPVTGEVYNLAPSPTEPARLGIQLNALGLFPAAHVESTVRTRLTDYGLTSTTTNDIDKTLRVQSMSLTLWGSKLDHGSLAKSFMTLPTRCDVPATTTITVTSYAGANASASAGFTPTGCDQVPFTPSLELDPVTFTADEPGAASATLVVPDGDTNGRRQSYVRDVALQLPEGVGLNPPLGNGLVPCTEEEFGQFRDEKPRCPDSSVIGTVKFSTPLFAQPLEGTVYFGVPTPGERLRNFVSVEDPRLRVKLIGGVTVDETTGAITNVFKDSPQVPFTEFKFTYNGGPRAVLTSPFTCGTRTVHAPMTPWSGTGTKDTTKDFDTINCPPPAFTPTLGVTMDNPAAGADTGMAVHIERQDRQTRLKGVTVQLPTGLAGHLGAVPACSLADARAAACSDASQVGTAAVSVGTGPAPLSLPGKVFLTEGFENAIAGLAITVPAKVPALDLGTVVTIAKLVVRGDAGIDVITDNLPQSVAGIPVAYRTIDLHIDKPGFMVNGTSCAAQAIHGVFTGIDGTTATSDAPYQATGCEALPFSPTLDAAIGEKGQTAKNSHPPLTVVVGQGAGQAAMKKTTVVMPAGVSVDLNNLSAACSDAQLESGTCPAGSRIGSVRADTPLLPQPLSGGAYLMLPKPGQLPGLALDLGLVRLRGDVSFGAGDGRLTTVFNSIPDVPLSRLVLSISGGPKGVLSTAVNLCSSDLVVDSTFVSQGDVTRTARTAAAVSGCKALSASGRLSGVKKRKPAATLSVVSATPLRGLSIALPRQLRPAAAKRLRRGARLALGGKFGSRAPVKWRKKRLVVSGLKGARAVTLVLRRGALRQRGRIKVGQRLRFTVVATDTKGKRRSVRVTVRAKR